MSSRGHIIDLIEHGTISPKNIGDALIATKVEPDGKAWATFIDIFLLWLGGLALAFAAIFFVAHNWNAIGRFTKFGMVEILILLATAAYWKLAEHRVAGKVSLLVATIFLGALLALYEQTYQTGADTWQLFFNWALLMMPWALIGRFPTLWIVWVVLINLSILLYHHTFADGLWLMFVADEGMLWLVFLFNTLALILWELLSDTLHWLSERWATRLLAISSGVPITLLTLYAIFDHRDVSDLLSILAWVSWLAVLYMAYRYARPDLFMLASGCLSGIVVVIAFASKLLLPKFWSLRSEDPDPGAFLFLTLMVIALGTGAAVWLRHIHREWHS